MGELVFVGLGLNDEKGITLRGLEESKTADSLFAELYTSLLPYFSLQRLEELIGKKITLISRHDLEEDNGTIVLNSASRGKTVLLVPGDPFVATTHVTLRIESEKKGIRTRIIHGASIMSAIVGLSGLHNYKFGKTVTVPFLENFSETPYNVIGQNKKLGLHTLCLLDLKSEETRFLTIREGLEQLLAIENRRKEDVVTHESIAVGVARVGSENPSLRADFAERLLRFDFGSPPHSMIIPGQLHFMEAEALINLAGAPQELRQMAK
jgi:diphthine synthase